MSFRCGCKLEHVNGALAVSHEDKALPNKHNAGRSLCDFAGKQTSYGGHSSADLR